MTCDIKINLLYGILESYNKDKKHFVVIPTK